MPVSAKRRGSRRLTRERIILSRATVSFDCIIDSLLRSPVFLYISMVDYESNNRGCRREDRSTPACIVIRVRTMKLSGRVFNMQFRKVPAPVCGFCAGRKLRTQLVLSSLSLILLFPPLFLSLLFFPRRGRA